jgi:hypothetical protein
VQLGLNVAFVRSGRRDDGCNHIDDDDRGDHDD